MSAVIKNNDPQLAFNEKLEYCLLNICKQLSIPVPIWMEKNTKEFAHYKKTFFTNEQFIEDVWFDRFEIAILEM